MQHRKTISLAPVLGCVLTLIISAFLGLIITVAVTESVENWGLRTKAADKPSCKVESNRLEQG